MLAVAMVRPRSAFGVRCWMKESRGTTKQPALTPARNRPQAARTGEAAAKARSAEKATRPSAPSGTRPSSTFSRESRPAR